MSGHATALAEPTRPATRRSRSATAVLGLPVLLGLTVLLGWSAAALAQMPRRLPRDPGGPEPASVTSAADGVAPAPDGAAVGSGPVRILAAPRTMWAGESVQLEVIAHNPSGRRLAFPTVRWTTSNDSVLEIDRTGRVVGVRPGEAFVEVTTSAGRAAALVRVEGVTLTVNGKRRTVPGELQPTDVVEVENGRLRLRFGRATRHAQRAGIVADVLVDEEWRIGTSPEFGDYTYVGSGVDTPPTRVTAVRTSPREVVVRMEFRKHYFEPQGTGVAVGFDSRPYPFEKTIWLRAGEDGYYALVRLLEHLPSGVTDAEHEIGFGGLWGPSRIDTGRDEFEPTGKEAARRLNVPPRVAAARLTRPDDPLTRILVPLRATPFMVPQFGGGRYGGVWAHSLVSESYGAYLYMAPTTRALSPNRVCGDAWRDAPFTLAIRPTTEERESCGAP